MQTELGVEQQQPDTPSSPETRSFTADEPKHAGRDGPALWDRQSETQQGEKTPTISPMQNCAPLLLTQSAATVKANETGVLLNTADSCMGTY